VTTSVTRPANGKRGLGTFEGVFVPTLLTILGVMMYLRTGWVVGQVGLLGAWAIIGAASVITMATALSLSSVATNVRLGAGGPYGIIARSLGLEIGGSIGIPLYLSQAASLLGCPSSGPAWRFACST
jgi:amino acid transporter